VGICDKISGEEKRLLVLRTNGSQVVRNPMSFPIRSDEQGADDAPAPSVSATVPDWSREACPLFGGSPSRQLLAAVRAYQQWRELPGYAALTARRMAVARHRFWSVVCGCEIPLAGDIGGGLIMPHPQGVVIHPDAKLGPNCLIFQQVTIGIGGSRPGAPIIGGHVDIGAGAKILGGVTIGDHAKIGANAVVLTDVPPGATAVGIPARVTPRSMAAVSQLGSVRD
jgi:serine O-acetyltransferase